MLEDKNRKERSMDIYDILERASKVSDSAEVYHVDGVSRALHFKGWKVHSSSSSRLRGWAVRLNVGGRIGTAATTDENAAEKIIDDALNAAKISEKVDITFPGKTEVPKLDIYDPRVESATVSTLVEFCKELRARLEKYRSDCDMEVAATSGVKRIHVVNTEGFDGAYEATEFSLSGVIIRMKEGDIYMAWDYYVDTHLPQKTDEAVNPIAAKIDDVMRYADRILPVPSGRVPVVFTPMGTMLLLIPLLAGLSGNNIYTKSSPIYNKLGERLFDPKLCVYDDGTLARKPASKPFDCEGVPKRRLALVEEGVLKNFIFDIVTAKKSGYQTNGCAERSLFSPPAPSPSNVIIKEGETPLAEILADVKEGIMIESVLGLGQGNVLSGAFSNPVSTAFKIEDGEITGRIKNAAIAGNIYQNLKEITAISREGRWFDRYFAPYIRLDNVSVVGKS